ncbi:oxidoreductase [Sulfurovum sp. bin170]|uniref:class II aldolase/adducin family protein n=1 Tax=Sulfurovum sp. bin170 TaxID=2695268 RepID=UPI0013DE8B22|nr:class II aldolase/adducin family protein [Sulfurovum sp. bin170]NEW60679.1 oxidoreductase [Sulfurovum sp. bin170]
MKNLYNTKKTKKLDDLELRVYTSRLLGSDDSLVLHGGGNTSVKIGGTLYVKGSGWDLATIEKEGFSPTKTIDLIMLLEHERLSDSDMVKYQKEALIDKSAPNPSVEAILHALIPYKFVDHTHADAMVTISNTNRGEELIEEIYEGYLIIPYVMPGFLLAKIVYNMTDGIEWENIKGIILHNHGIFTFANDAKESYDNMIDAVNLAERYIRKAKKQKTHDLNKIQELISEAKGYEVTLKVNQSKIAKQFATKEDMTLSQQGVLTPEHIIRTKRVPIIFEDDYEKELNNYIKAYHDYFERHYIDSEIMLNPAPNWAVLRDFGTISFGKDEKEASIIEDINNHTMKAMINAKKLGGYKSINEEQSFYMEYWELEQMKLK